MITYRGVEMSTCAIVGQSHRTVRRSGWRGKRVAVDTPNAPLPSSALPPCPALQVSDRLLHWIRIDIIAQHHMRAANDRTITNSFLLEKR